MFEKFVGSTLSTDCPLEPPATPTSIIVKNIEASNLIAFLAKTPNRSLKIVCNSKLGNPPKQVGVPPGRGVWVRPFCGFRGWGANVTLLRY